MRRGTGSYSSGLIERSEVFLFFTAMTLMPQYFSVFGGVFSALERGRVLSGLVRHS